MLLTLYYSPVQTAHYPEATDPLIYATRTRITQTRWIVTMIWLFVHKHNVTWLGIFTLIMISRFHARAKKYKCQMNFK